MVAALPPGRPSCSLFVLVLEPSLVAAVRVRDRKSSSASFDCGNFAAMAASAWFWLVRGSQGG